MVGRIVALDYGTVRTGVAVTDPLKLIASGLTTVPTRELLYFLKTYLEKEEVDLFVIGEPKQMDNTPSESEVFIQGFLVGLKASFPGIPVKRHDERFTSRMAKQSMITGGLGKKHRRNKALVDEISATLILQSYLNSIE
jgi:putative Holliday junction resolvase